MKMSATLTSGFIFLAAVCSCLLIGSPVTAKSKKQAGAQDKAAKQAAVCEKYSILANGVCGWNKADSNDQCQTFLRLGKPSRCAAKVDAALSCTRKNFSVCPGKRCCNNKKCDPADSAMEACFRAFCKANKANADCRSLFGDNP